MNWSLRKLACMQIMGTLENIKNIEIPASGWIKTIRQTLGMSGQQLAKRCGVSQQSISRAERDEALKKTSIETLEKIAEQLGCKLVYAFVPYVDLIEIIENQAQKKASQTLGLVSHTMLLEDQKVGLRQFQEQIELLKEDLIQNNIKEIWE